MRFLAQSKRSRLEIPGIQIGCSSDRCPGTAGYAEARRLFNATYVAMGRLRRYVKMLPNHYMTFMVFREGQEMAALRVHHPLRNHLIPFRDYSIRYVHARLFYLVGLEVR